MQGFLFPLLHYTGIVETMGCQDWDIFFFLSFVEDQIIFLPESQARILLKQNPSTHPPPPDI